MYLGWNKNKMDSTKKSTTSKRFAFAAVLLSQEDHGLNPNHNPRKTFCNYGREWIMDWGWLLT